MDHLQALLFICVLQFPPPRIYAPLVVPYIAKLTRDNMSTDEKKSEKEKSARTMYTW